MRGSRAAVPKGARLFSTQGDFRSSFHLSVCPEMANLKSVRVDWWPEMMDLRIERAYLSIEKADSRPDGLTDA